MKAIVVTLTLLEGLILFMKACLRRSLIIASLEIVMRRMRDHLFLLPSHLKRVVAFRY